jgi:hypothetical protein
MESYTTIDSRKEAEEKPDGEYHVWRGEIEAAEKELKRFQVGGRKVVKMFRASESDTSGVDTSLERKYNLFPANVNILQTSLMNQAPQPTVDREFDDPMDDIGRVACRIMERAIASHNNRNFHTADMMKQVVLDMLVPGVGVSWHTYYAKTETRTETLNDPTAGLNLVGIDNDRPEPDTLAESLEYEEVVEERVLDEYVYWEDLLWSPARCFEEVRWIGRKIYMTRDQLVDRFGDKVGKAIPLDYKPSKQDNSVESKNQIMQQACIYEIWDKPTECVYWLSKGYEKIIEEKEDYLELDDFFPCPVPLVSTVSNGQYIPIPDYHYAKDQYRELNDVNTRISLLVRACRVVGVYDKASPQVIAVLSNAAENQLVPVDQWAAFAEKGGLKGVIDWVPLDQIIATIAQLTSNREDVKNQIYEVTGMSDIIRGATKASETLGAQKIKTAYASMRIQQRQKNVVQYCSSVFDLQCQIMRKHMDIIEIQKLAQVPFMDEDPQVVEQALQLIKMPDFILRCKVESDSLSDIDFQAEKQDRMEYMGTITNYLKEILPTMQSDPTMGPFLMRLLQFSLAGFKVGKKFEGQLDKTFAELTKKLENPEPPQPSPEEQKVQAQIQLMQKEGEQNAQEHQETLQFQRESNQMKLGFEQQKGQIKLAQVTQKANADSQATQIKSRTSIEQAGLQSQLKREEFGQRMEQKAQEFATNQALGGSFDRAAAGGKKSA